MQEISSEISGGILGKSRAKRLGAPGRSTYWGHLEQIFGKNPKKNWHFLEKKKSENNTKRKFGLKSSCMDLKTFNKNPGENLVETPRGTPREFFENSLVEIPKISSEKISQKSPGETVGKPS